MKFVFTCGGTAGHINPALAVAGRLKELMPDCGILFIGAQGHMETKLVPREGYEIRTLTVTSLSRSFDLSALKHNLETMKNVAVSLHDAKVILREYKPDVVVGTGGYVCYPVLEAAHELGIPCTVHESNAVPGLTTKMLADKVDKIMVGFSESKKQYRHAERVEVTGTPVRGEFDLYQKQKAKRELGIPEGKPLVVSVWGSLGSGYMNKTIGDMIAEPYYDGSFALIHSVGSGYYHDFMEKLSLCAPDYRQVGVDVREYIFDMPKVMAAADLIMCRAGASTLAELNYLGKPALIVPSPNVTNNHQEKNARVLEKAGGAKVLLENEFNAAKLYEEVCALVKDEEKLAAMSHAMRALSVDDAVEKICSIILDLAEKR